MATPIESIEWGLARPVLTHRAELVKCRLLCIAGIDLFSFEIETGLARRELCSYFSSVSCVPEIESAIERLSPVEVAELAAWLEEYQQMINASAEVFSMYDKEESE